MSGTLVNRRSFAAVLATLGLTTFGLAAAIPSTPAAAQQGSAEPLVVFAAASMKDALDRIGAQWTTASGHSVKFSYAASSVLARQIEQGAPASIFVSADLDWMDYVAKRDLIVPDSRINLLGNELVLIAPKGQANRVEIKSGFDLVGLLRGGRLAMGEVTSVPAGKYGKAALEHLGVWPSVADRLAQAENVRAALVFVARGETPVGIVYKTDAAAEPRVEIIGTFPQDSYPPIIYPAALIKDKVTADAKDFLAYMKSDAARMQFEAAGFVVKTH